MKGYLVSFFTVEAATYKHKHVTDWMLDLTKRLKLRGVTVIRAAEGFGAHGRLHSARFFELADQPVEIVLAVSDDECERLFAELQKETIHLFYVKSEVEFGTINGRPQ